MEKLYYTDDQFNRLSPFKSYFNQAVLSAYAAALSSTSINTILDVAREIGWDEQLNLACGRCRIRLLTFVGQRYIHDANIRAQQTSSSCSSCEESANTTKSATRQIIAIHPDGTTTIYESLAAASKAYGVSVGTIINWLKGKPTDKTPDKLAYKAK